MAGQDRTLRRGDGYVEERLRKNGETAFVARWHDGTRWRGKTFTTYDDAEDHVRTIGRAKRAGRYTPDDELTVAEMLADYLRRGADRWSSNTVGMYTACVDNIIVPRFGSRRVQDVTPRMLQALMDGLGRGYGPPTLARVRTILSGAFREAVRLGVIDRNPVSGVRLRAPKRVERQVWTRDEAVHLLASVQHDAMLSAWFTVALTTGMRPGELRALQWGDIDMERGTITVRRTATRDAERRVVMSTTTKTGRTRTVPIPESAIAALQRWRPMVTRMRLKAEHWRDLDLVFPRPDGNLCAQQTWSRRHTAACHAAGVTAIPPHGTRHAAATLMVEAGIDVKTISAILGHHSAGFTLDVYVSVTDTMQRQAADTMGELLKGTG